MNSVTLSFYQLDVYYPPTSDATTPKPPILCFFYGGGFTSGDRNYPPPGDLCYSNLGAFFASRGILTVIADYRLVPEVSYPEPAEDVRDAAIYVVQNVVEGDTNRLFLMGHSAGAIHLTTFLLHAPSLLESTTLTPRIKGAVLSAGAYHFNGPPVAPPTTLTQYYGTADQQKARVPLSLLEAASSDAVAQLPPILMVMAEHDVEGVIVTNDDFAALLEKRTGKKIERLIAQGHNHISPNWALSTGEGEDWGEKVAEWIKSH